MKVRFLTQTDQETMVQTVPQSLTEAQKTQVRANIGLDDYMERENPGLITAEASGGSIALSDSLSMRLRGLGLYGSTVHDGTPSPDSPVELVSPGGAGSITVSIGSSEADGSAQTLTVSTPNGLPGIPVSSGGNYTDSDGQQWVCDEIDFASGKYIQRIAKKVLDGTEYWGRTFKVYDYDREPVLSWSLGKAPTTCHDLNLIASHDVAMTAHTLIWDAPHGFALYGEGDDGSGYRYLFARVDRSLYGATEDSTDSELCALFKTFIGSQYEAGTPLTVYYILHTPVETALSEDVLAAYGTLRTSYPETAITNDHGAWMRVSYAADTKLYIDKQIAALSAAIVNI